MFRVVDNSVLLTDFEPGPKGSLAGIADRIIEEYQTASLTPPDWEKVIEQNKVPQNIAEELLQYLLRQGLIIKVTTGIYFSARAVETTKEKVLSLLTERSEFTTAEAKEAIGTSRKFLIPLLEYLDTQKLTRRTGDKRGKF